MMDIFRNGSLISGKMDISLCMIKLFKKQLKNKHKIEDSWVEETDTDKRGAYRHMKLLDMLQLLTLVAYSWMSTVFKTK